MSNTSSRNPSMVAMRRDSTEERYTESYVSVSTHTARTNASLLTWKCGNSATARPSRLLVCPACPERKSENGKGMKSIKKRLYVVAQTRP